MAYTKVLNSDFNSRIFSANVVEEPKESGRKFNITLDGDTLDKFKFDREKKYDKDQNPNGYSVELNSEGIISSVLLIVDSILPTDAQEISTESDEFELVSKIIKVATM